MTRKEILEALRNGKLGVDEARHAVRQNGHGVVRHDPAPPSTDGDQTPSRSADRAALERLETELVQSLAAALFTAESEITLDRNFKELGLDSIVSVEWINAIKKQYGVKIPATKVYDYPTIQKFAAYLSGLIKVAAPASASVNVPHAEMGETPVAIPSSGLRPVPPASKATGRIAIVGMSGRYPGAADLTQFWQNLAAGKNSIREIPPERWDVNAYYDPDPAKPGKVYCRWLGALDDIDRFDAPFFMISPAEAEGMDPQYRIFLEQAYQAFEDAGYSGHSLSNRRCGVYMGVMNSEYVHLLGAQQAPALNTGNSHSIAAARISYFLNLKGPAIPIDTACSSSLVATHLACQALRTGEIEMALVGGVTLYLTAASYIGMCGAGMLSADGQCKSFDNGANGFVPGEGAGALVLKRLEDAERDRDCIHGVILGSGINQDGRTNGITAPSVTSQIELEREVYRRFDIDPDTIDYVEAHGTGTKLGDPVELEALTTVFRERTGRQAFCGLGSVKSNIGHTSAAAGMAGVQKMLLCFKHQTLVPTLHFRAANQHCDFEDSPFYVNTETKPWRAREDAPRRAAISSMGFSGTNAHVVVEEYTGPAASRDVAGAPQAIVLSAKNEARLREAARNLRSFLTSGARLPSLRDLAYTLQVGRDAMEERVALVADSATEVVAKLDAFLDGRSVTGLHRGRVPRLKGKLALQEPDETMARRIADAIGRGEWSDLLERWVTGLVFDWSSLYRTARPYRVSLPTYPFAPERYWVGGQPLSPQSAAAPVPATASSIAAVRDHGEGVYSLHLESGTTPAPTEAIVGEIVATLEQLRSREAARVVVLSGDLPCFDAAPARSGAPLGEIADRLGKAIITCDLPVIACAKGNIAGLAAAVMGAADFVVCAEESEFRFGANDLAGSALRHRVEQRFGVAGSSQAKTARELKQRGAGFPIVPARDVDPVALQLAREIAQAPRGSIVLLKRHLGRIRSSAPAAGFDHDTTDFLGATTPERLVPASNSPVRSESISPVVKFEVFPGGIVLLTLQDTESKNAFSPALAEGLAACFQRIRGDRDCKVVVLTGYGNYFACGGTKEALLAIQEGRAKFTDRIVSSLPLDCEIPVIAAMQGHGIGAGWAMGMFCDYAIFGAESTYHSPYLRYGFTPGAGSTLALPDRLGCDLGAEVLFTAREYPGHELARRGMKYPVWPRAEVLPQALQIAQRLALASREELVGRKAARVRHLRDRLDAVYAQEVAMHEQTFVGNDEVSARIATHFGAEPATRPAAHPATPPSAPIEKPVGVVLKATSGAPAFTSASLARPKLRALAAPAAFASQGATAAPVDRPETGANRSPVVADPEQATAALRQYLKQSLADALHTRTEAVDEDLPFIELGVDSVISVTWVRGINTRYGLSIGATRIYDYPDVRQFANFLHEEMRKAGKDVPAVPPPGKPASGSVGQPVGEVIVRQAAEVTQEARDAGVARSADQQQQARAVTAEKTERAAPAITIEPPARKRATSDAIAVIGMAGRFPKSPTLAAFWDNIAAGRNCISEIPASRWPIERFYDPDPTRTGTTCSKWMGVLEEVDRFDPLFFQISPAEARMMDPQQRLFIEACWNCLEDAGIHPRTLSGSNCGVFAGCGMGDYGLTAERTGVIGTTGVAPSILPARVSYLLNLKGPSLAIDTACSASLVAVANACDNLILGNCDQALAGGVLVMTGPSLHVGMSQGGMLSPDGRCFTFDDRANGFVPGEGVGVVLLKRLSDAMRDGDIIHGVIRGWGLNQDGKTNGITAPSMVSQMALERGIYERFGLNPESISLVEAHGTGTRLGDPIEVEALTAAFRQFTPKQGYCALGSVKSNIGHLGVAAGIAGLLKVLLAIRHRTLPPTINFATLNPHIPLAGSPFFVSEAARAWEANAGAPRRATVSSFGFSGTNAHLVIEEAPAAPKRLGRTEPAAVVLSAKTDEALRNVARALSTWLASGADATSSADLHDIAYTLQVGREAMGERLGLLVDSRAGLQEALTAYLDGRAVAGIYRDQAKRNKDAVAAFFAAEKSGGTLESWIRERNLAQILEWWTKGLELDWNRLYGDERPRRVSLPGYPFARERYWLENTRTEVRREPARAAEPSDPGSTLVARPIWRERATPALAKLPAYERQVVLLVGFSAESERKVEAEFPNARCLSVTVSAERLDQTFADAARQMFEVLKQILGDKTTGRTLVQAVIASDGPAASIAALSGLFKTAHLENPKLATQVIETEATSDLVQTLRQAMAMSESGHLQRRRDRWAVPAMEEIAPAAAAVSSPWKHGGVYLITGGAGGLGLIFAAEIARQAQGPVLVLVGRSPLDGERQAAIDRFVGAGATVVYRQVDVADSAAVDSLVLQIRADHGRLDGVLHAAGVIRDNFILKKSTEEFSAVLAPKVAGTWNLDRATRELALDMFVLFSSGAGATGNVGQADYAAANAFLDAFAHQRNALVAEGRRTGRTVSINWPLWQDGGMRVDPATQRAVRENTGMMAMDTEAGLRAFASALASGESQVTVVAGDVEKIRSSLREAKPAAPTPEANARPPSADHGAMREQTLARLKRLLGEIVDLAPERIESDEPLETYGIDSLMVTRLNQQLARVFPEVSQTLFFEYQTLAGVAGHLVDAFPGETARWIGFDRNPPSNPTPRLAPTDSAAADRPGPAVATINAKRDAARPGVDAPIAIIGICGHYAQAETLSAFWENLKTGRNCVTEIPPDRWSLDGFFHPDPEEAIQRGLSYSKWGSFLSGFAHFDPLFFQISPLEAQGMDPQERLFLQASWEVLESAGYTRARVAETIDSSVGVFVGITKTGFEQYRADWRSQGETVVPYTSFGSVANRVSYVLNLKGPSMPIDTMCSSSLTAIHEACEHLRRGSCRMAIAGGVNLYLHPSSYVGLCAQRMLSRDGACKSFGADGNGFVPGEGVGAVLLKPLAEAIADRDPIHAIIRGTAVNHGGKTNGYTVPNPNAQRDLIRAALHQGGIDARHISCIEAHGTGTELGDPIEVTGLTQAFAADTTDTGFCALSSVKSNLGHLEAAAGIAGVTKVVLQLKGRTLVPTLHADTLNPKINFGRTPFVVQRKSAEWPRPVVGGVECPRVAGVSSFGAGGANAHVVIEEPPETSDARPERSGPALVVLSAKTEERLRVYVRRLGQFLDDQAKAAERVNLHDLAYTLQIGREPMEERVAFIAATLDELRAQLAAFLVQPESAERCIRGRVQRGSDGLAELYGDEDMAQTIASWLRKGKLARIAELWVRGAALDWRKLHGDAEPRRIVLPTYPFAEERYWVDLKSTPRKKPGFLHPLVHANTSDLSGLGFTSRFTGDEFFAADHVVNGSKILPGVAYLEMARFAAARVAGATDADPVGAILRHVVWVRPISLSGDAGSVHLRLGAAGKDGLSFSVTMSGPEGDDLVRCQGFVLDRARGEAPVVDLERLRAEIAERRIDGAAAYAAFAAMGMNYGPALRAIEEIATGRGQALARIARPAVSASTHADYVLHPSLLDAALQSCIGLAAPDSGLEKITFVPYAIDEVEVVSACPTRVWVWIRPSAAPADGRAQKLDLDLVDENGRVCVALRGLAFRRFERVSAGENSTAALLATPHWTSAPVPSNVAPVAYDRRVVLTWGIKVPSPQQIAQFGPDAIGEELPIEPGSPADRFTAVASRAFETVRRLLGETGLRKCLLQIVVPADAEARLCGGLAGLLKTAQLENPNFSGQLIVVDAGLTANDLLGVLEENGRRPHEVQIRHDRGFREVLEWRELAVAAAAANPPWQDGGVYLITGGAGGVGRIFAAAIARQVSHATVILCGRSPLRAEHREELRALEHNGNRIVYREADVTRAASLLQLVAAVTADHGAIRGVIHAAGIIRDRLIANKSPMEFSAVLAPKVSGVANLDEATAHLALDFFVLFSAGAGVFGNPGQADYATANAFLDQFARYRNRLVSAGKRHGRTVSLDWPLWAAGGMTMDDAAIATMKTTLGLTPIASAAGVDAFARALAADAEQVLVASGDLPRLRSLLNRTTPPISATAAARAEPASSALDRTIEAKTVEYFRRLLSSTLRVPESRVQADGIMSDLGIDSVVVMGLTHRLEQTFGSLSKTLFFEHQTIRGLARYFIRTHAEKLQSLLEPAEPTRATMPDASTPPTRPKPLAVVASPRVTEPARARSTGALDVAIIGLSGRYPQANTVDAFWNVLRDGRDCITEIPADRWDWRKYYSGDPASPRGHSSKWGGFIDDVDKFDPQFFNLSPKIAPYLDPQERLILEEAWKALEDAGYRRDDLRDQSDEDGASVGVYVGAMYGEYQLFGAEASLAGQRLGFAGNLASIANRLSYVLNLHGPSMMVDTMCSSSLTCLHLACQDLAAGRTNYALAGGVNVTIHPNKYLMLSGGQFLSPAGRCESFGEGGAGYIPSEGVGVVVLKRLADAERDGDHIYGVIKGTAVNHGGRTHGYSVPNPKSQERVLAQALREAGIDPRAVSYIEAHGTGTKLGDPIEIAGLVNAFANRSREPRCWIGSVKSNIGHCEAAAGIAGLTKVLLQMKHGMIAPSLHSRVLNPHIDFAATPFVVNQTLREWERPTIDGRTAPRIAGISSFGAGGSNAHVVVEEYCAPEGSSRPSTPAQRERRPALVVLSAKNDERLTSVVRALRDHLSATDEGRANRLEDIAYTLQVGREPMDVRLGWVVSSMEELRNRLERFLQNPRDLADGVQGRVGDESQPPARNVTDGRVSDASGDRFVAVEPSALLRQWVAGADIDWAQLYGGAQPRRISLPTYPFARKRYWVDAVTPQPVREPAPIAEAGSVAEAVALPARIRPLAAASESVRTWTPAPAAKPAGIPLRPLPATDFAPTPSDLRPAPQVVAVTTAPSPSIESLPSAAPTEIVSVARQTLETELLASLAKALFLEPGEISLDKPFLEMGLDSIVGVEWVNGLNRKYGLTIPANQVYEHPNLRKFSLYLHDQMQATGAAKASSAPTVTAAAVMPPPAPKPTPMPSPVAPPPPTSHAHPAAGKSSPAHRGPAKATEIAIIGMSGQFPGGQTLDEFWALLQTGRTAFTEFPSDRDWDLSGIHSAGSGVAAVGVTKGAFLKEVDRFDPLFFQISPKEAAAMDPGERIFLQESWKALEDAGVAPTEISGRRWGVFCGNGGDYSLRLLDVVGYSPHVTLAQVPSRVSYCLNLTGPSQSVDAGCASALLAIGQACDQLATGKCEVALAGGVFIHSTPNLIVSASQVELLAKNGNGGRALDRTAGGMMPSEAAGVLVLKPLAAALAAGDRIHGVIEGWGSNHNGKTNGMVAPNVDAQAALFSEVYDRYGIDPNGITLVEANASGLPLADVAEVQALTRAFRAKTARRQFCALGSVENNIGHAFHASGMSHVMKVLLSLRHRQIPAMANVREPNPALGLEQSPFYINGETIPWRVNEGERRRAAISSFGATGANVHLVIAEAPPPETGQLETAGSANRADVPVLIPLSAKTEAGLRQRCRDLQDYLQNRLADDQATLGGVAANLLRRRSHFAQRCAIVADNLATLQQALADVCAGRENQHAFLGRVDGEPRLRPSFALLAREAIDALVEGRGGRENVVLLADLYVQGASLDLTSCFSARELVPLSLPGYPFERRRCWIGRPQTSRASRGVAAGAGVEPAVAATGESLDPLSVVKGFLAELSGLSAAEIDPSATLSTYGIDSLLGMRLLNRLNARFGGSFDAILLVNETVGGLAETILRRGPAPVGVDRPPAFAGDWVRPAFVDTVEWEVPADLPDRATGEQQLEALIASGVGVWRRPGRLCFEFWEKTQSAESLARLVPQPGALHALLEDGRRYFPATDMQRFALHESEVNQRTSFNLCQGFWVDAPVQLPTLAVALNDLVRRHSIFRTGARRLGSHWMQIVHDELRVDCREIQWVGIEAKEHFEAELARFQQERIDHRFDVGRAPLLEVYVIHNGRSLGAVFFCAHHFHADGFTLYFFQQELHRRYTARLRQTTESLPAPQAEYAHFALSQASPDRAAHGEYWRAQLAEVRRPARLRDAPGNLDEGTEEKTGLVELELTAARLAELQAYNRQNRTTLTQLLTAAVATLLYRLTGAVHPIQLVFNLRDRAEYEAVLGDFSSSLPLVLPMRRDFAWRDVLQAYAHATLELQRHRHFDFSLLLRPGADGEAPGMLGDVALDSNDRDAFGAVTAFAERLIDLRMEDRRPVAPLLVCLVKTHGRVTIPFMYDRSRFSRRSVSLFAENVLILLDEMVRDGAGLIDHATILPELAQRLGSEERSGSHPR